MAQCLQQCPGFQALCGATDQGLARLAPDAMFAAKVAHAASAGQSFLHPRHGTDFFGHKPDDAWCGLAFGTQAIEHAGEARPVAAQRLKSGALLQALGHAARVDRIAKGVGRGDAWDELLQLGLRLSA